MQTLRWAAGAALFISTAAAGQDAPKLVFPVDCELGEDCFFQALFDHDPTASSSDYACGTLTRDDHGGTDIALPDLAAMRAGVDVLAAAPGVVSGIRDRLPDISADDPASDYGTEDCGNGVAIDHGHGWTTQYCHMKLGTIAVAFGDPVEAGTPLGEIGLSGATSFPHLHLSVFRNGQKVDPFAPNLTQCGEGGETLWADNLSVPSAGFLKVGFASTVPPFSAMAEGLETEETLRPTAPILIWVSGYGSRPGDELTVSITHPLGTFHESVAVMDRRQEVWQRFTGRRYTTIPWPSGPYTAVIEYRRNGALIAADELTATIP